MVGKFPRSVAKFIRAEKAKIRRTVPDPALRERLERELVERLRVYRRLV